MKEMRRDMEEWNRILVIYDIEIDKVRNKTVRILESYGVRVQKSAFECHLNNKRLNDLKNKLRRIITDNDSIRIYQVRDSCFEVSKYSDVPIYSSKTIVI